MASAPRSRKRAMARPPLWQRWLESQTVRWGLIVTAFSLLSFAFGTTRDLVLKAWRHYTGAELAHKLEPEVAAARNLAAEAAGLAKATLERASVGEERLKIAEKRLDAAEDTKRIEQERTQAVETVQRAACLEGDLATDACGRLGYPTKQMK